MNGFFRPMRQQKALKPYKCIWCFGPILRDEKYCRQSGIYDGRGQDNKYHQECWDDLDFGDPSSDGEFMPGSGEVPERVRIGMSGNKGAA